jgi:hypothetical protein
MPPADSADARFDLLVHQARNALAAAHGRTQLLRRRAVRAGAPDPAALAAELRAVERAISRACDVLAALEADRRGEAGGGSAAGT